MSPDHIPSPLPCPCGHTCRPRFVEGVSAVAIVDYYRCEQCGHIWTEAKSGRPDLEADLAPVTVSDRVLSWRK